MLTAIDIPGCSLIEQKDFDQIFKIDRMKQLVARNGLLSTEADKSTDVVQQIADYLKRCGAAVVVCSKCGESNILDLDELTA